MGGGNADDTEPSVGKLGSHVVEFVCPRCAQVVESRFYGPCDGCRGELRTKFLRVERIVELGGDVVHPGERFAICRDSEGNPFGLAG